MTEPAGIRKRVLERLAEQRALVQSLLSLREQIQGSLFARYGLCGKENCACRQGYRHGPYYVLSSRSGGRGGFAYVASEQIGEARELVSRHREFRKGLRRLKRMNQELLRLLKRYQTTMTRRGGRRLGLVASA